MTNKTPIPIDEPAKIADMDINDLRELVSRYHAKGSRTERYLKRTLSLLEDLAAGRVAIVPVDLLEVLHQDRKLVSGPYDYQRGFLDCAEAAKGILKNHPPYKFGGGE